MSMGRIPTIPPFSSTSADLDAPGAVRYYDISCVPSYHVYRDREFRFQALQTVDFLDAENVGAYFLDGRNPVRQKAFPASISSRSDTSGYDAGRLYLGVAIYHDSILSIFVTTPK